MSLTTLSRLFAGVALLAALLPTQPSPAAELTGEDVYKRALKSTVWIVVPDNEGIHMGSGSLIDVKQRLILTNHHVIMSMKDTVLVQFPILDKKGELIPEKKLYFEQIKSNGAISAKVLFSEKTKDLAILQLDRLPKGVNAVHLAETTPASGANVHSVGNPGASDALFVYSPGTVRSSYVKTWSAKGGSTILNIEAKIIESTSPTSPGDSGGPLFNGKGEQVGVTQGGLVDPKATGYSYFIDASEVKAMLKNHKITLSANSGPTTETATKPSKGADDDDELFVPESKSDNKSEAKTKPDSKKGATDPKKEKENSAVADEKAADNKLGIIKTLIDQGKKDTATTRLNDLIKAYPSTEAAKEAKELLKKLK